MARGVRALGAGPSKSCAQRTHLCCNWHIACFSHAASLMKELQTPPAAWLGLMIGALVSCLPATRARTETAPPDQPASATFVPPVAASSASSQLALDVPGFLSTVLVVPSGAEARPLVVAAHGAGGAPEWDCDYWARLTREHAFVLCPRGTAMGAGSFYFKQHHALSEEVQAAVAAARQQFPRILPTSGVYAGFSQGASMGALMISSHAEQFPYVVLVEGFTQWNIALGQRFAKNGGRGVLFVCGTGDCASKAEASTAALKHIPLRARAEYAKSAGHTGSGRVGDLVAGQLPWLLADDPSWAYLAAR